MSVYSAPNGAFWIRIAPAMFLLLWSGGFIFLKIGLQYADPFTFLALRYFCVLGVLGLVALWVRPQFPSTRKGWMALIGVGLFLQSGYFAFTYLSLRYGAPTGVVAVITCQQPILVGLLAPAIAGERTTFVRWAGLAMGVVGATGVIIANADLHTTSLAGLTFAGLALVSITSSTLIEKRFAVQTHPVAANLVQYGIGLGVTAPLAYVLEPMDVTWTLQFFVSLLYLVFGASLLAVTLLLAMIRRGEASRVSALFFLVPPTTFLMAFLFLGETLALASLPCIALAGAGVYIVMRRS